MRIYTSRHAGTWAIESMLNSKVHHHGTIDKIISRHQGA